MQKPGTRRILLAALVLSGLGACGGDGQSPADEPSTTTFRYQPAASAFDGCESLQQYLAATNAVQARLQNYVDIGLAVDFGDARTDAAPVATDAPAAGDAAENTAAPGDGTATNNQEAGVDEADFVKTAAGYIYLLDTGSLRIIDARQPQALAEVGSIEIEGRPRALLLHEHIAWVASELDPAPAGAALGQVKISLIDLADVTAPRLIRELALDGYYNTARRVGARVYLALHSGYPLYFGAPVAALTDTATPGAAGVPGLPQLTSTIWQNGVAGAPESEPLVACESVYHSETPNGTGIFTLSAFDLATPLGAVRSSAILGNSGVVYASEDALYVAAYEDPYWLWLPVDAGAEQPQPGTSVHKFSLGAQPAYAGSGRVDGHVLNQFSMSEHAGYLRIATTEDAWWRNDRNGPANRLFVLGEDSDTQDAGLAVLARLEGLGKPGERIFAARFMGERGYIVTAELTDPLYTLDLSVPLRPRQVGALEIPGFSTYLHPLGDSHLLALGRDGGGDLLLSLFDISDFAAPSRPATFKVSESAHSSAEYDHLAFTYYAAARVLAIPVFEDQTVRFEGFSPPYFNGLRLFRIDPDAALIEAIGEVDHAPYFQAETGWYSPTAIERSYFRNEAGADYVFAISPAAVTASLLTAPSVPVGSVVLPLQAPIWDTPGIAN